MNVSIKSFNVQMDIRNRGIELEVRTPDDQHIGDLIVTKTQLVWCEGRVRRRNGKTISWADFQALMNER